MDCDIDDLQQERLQAALFLLKEGFAEKESIYKEKLGVIEKNYLEAVKKEFPKIEELLKDKAYEDCSKKILQLKNIIYTLELRFAMLNLRICVQGWAILYKGEFSNQEAEEFFEKRAMNLLNKAEQMLNEDKVEEGKAVLQYCGQELTRYKPEIK